MIKTSDEPLKTGCEITRRGVAQALVLCGCAIAAMKTAAVAKDGDSPTVSLKAGDRFALEPDSGAPVAIKAADLKPGQAIMGAYPLDPASGALRTDTRFNMANLVRLSGEPKGDLLQTQGIAAFSSICTHKGCAITSWQPDNNHWRCFCHMSEFDAAAKGERVDGPATDPLPTIPIAIDAEGYIVATGGFSALPGGKA